MNKMYYQPNLSCIINTGKTVPYVQSKANLSIQSSPVTTPSFILIPITRRLSITSKIVQQPWEHKQRLPSRSVLYIPCLYVNISELK